MSFVRLGARTRWRRPFPDPCQRKDLQRTLQSE
ncbi:hypothetical protein PSPO01_10823 [Paraphaeosphaeria sporulosa]